MTTDHTAEELWQMYDKQGEPVVGKGVSKRAAYTGILHGASHVWVWRLAADGTIEVLLQLRAPGKRTWPERLDISAAGHIGNGEKPLTAAVRETQEEIGITIIASEIQFAGVHRFYVTANDGFIENEVRFIYTYQLPDNTEISMTDGEVSSVVWKPLEVMLSETTDDTARLYVPHGKAYFELVAEAIRLHAAKV
jgi:isopentenyl-diphosphate Delta-isomerase